MAADVRLLSLACNHCGANLEVPPTTRFVTCAYCNSKLEVHRTGNAAYTHVLESIDRRTGRMAEDMEVIRLHKELERIDREWLMERESHMTRDKHGQMHEPSGVGAVIMGIIAAGFGLFWTITAANIGAPFPFPLFGLIFVGVGIFAIIGGPVHARKYAEAQQQHRLRRERLLEELRQRER